MFFCFQISNLKEHFFFIQNYCLFSILSPILVNLSLLLISHHLSLFLVLEYLHFPFLLLSLAKNLNHHGLCAHVLLELFQILFGCWAICFVGFHPVVAFVL